MLSRQPDGADIPCSPGNPVKDGNQDARLERLHGETLAALQVFLMHAEPIKPA
ncbi:hypothetical protein ACVK00_002855 [Burkholderia sp. PvR073]|uniref:hypothetical protein n=1 Tax=Burkholderia TaxID=32008 RepID=UPI00254E43AB|nr:hypothetical protein [Burkholderia sp. lyk4-R2A-23]